MRSKYNLALSNLDIVLWKLRYPVFFAKDAPIKLLANLRLLIISDVLISVPDSFVDDVVRTLRLRSTEIYIITVDMINAVILPVNILDYCWLVGLKMLCEFCCTTFYTPSLSILKNNVDAKRDFWKQIYQCLN